MYDPYVTDTKFMENIILYPVKVMITWITRVVVFPIAVLGFLSAIAVVGFRWGFDAWDSFVDWVDNR